MTTVGVIGWIGFVVMVAITVHAQRQTRKALDLARENREALEDLTVIGKVKT